MGNHAWLGDTLHLMNHEQKRCYAESLRSLREAGHVEDHNGLFLSEHFIHESGNFIEALWLLDDLIEQTLQVLARVAM